MQTVVDGLPSSWETLMACVRGGENQPTFERLWHDCIEEEGRTSGKVTKEGNLALATKTKKFKKPFPRQKKKKKPQGNFFDMSKWNDIIATSLDILLKTAGKPRRSLSEGFKHLL